MFLRNNKFISLTGIFSKLNKFLFCDINANNFDTMRLKYHLHAVIFVEFDIKAHVKFGNIFRACKAPPSGSAL